jgi:hypothetical protein
VTTFFSFYFFYSRGLISFSLVEHGQVGCIRSENETKIVCLLGFGTYGWRNF